MQSEGCQCVTFVLDRWPEANKYMVGSGKFVSTRTGSPASFFGSQSEQSKQPLTEEIRLLSRVMTYIYFLIEIDEKHMKLSLFYLMHPANSNSHENRVFPQNIGYFGHGHFGLGHFGLGRSGLGHFGQAFFQGWTFRTILGGGYKIC